MVNFPAPVGGTPYQLDFAPSVLFGVLYALLVPLMLHRMLGRRSHTVLLIGTVAFSIERIIIYSLRAIQSRNEKRRFSPGLTKYMQITFSLGFKGIASDLVKIIHCIIVNPTFGSDMYFQSPAASTKGGIYAPPPPGTPDQPKLRRRTRMFTGILSLTFFSASVPGTIASIHYRRALRDQGKADQMQRLRVLSASVTLVLCFVLVSVIAWSFKMFPKNSKRATGIGAGVAVLMAIIAIYRVSVVHVKTTSLDGESSLNRPSAKAAFYIFHVLPEWLAIAIYSGRTSGNYSVLV